MEDNILASIAATDWESGNKIIIRVYKQTSKIKTHKLVEKNSWYNNPAKTYKQQ